MTRALRILKEFLHHLPYSAVGVAACLGILLGLEKMAWRLPPEDFFHVMHPLHLFLSAMVTTAIFWKYERSKIKAVAVGFAGAVVICTLSDILVPFLGGEIFRENVGFHLCLVEDPWLVYPSVFGGILVGITLLGLVDRGTGMTHLFHVLVSSLASFLYLVTFVPSIWENATGLAFGITLAAVWVPCCLSDIVFPLLFVKNADISCCGHH